MGKKNKKYNSKKQVKAIKNESVFNKLRPFLFPLLFGIGAVGAYFINANNLMDNVGVSANSGIQATWVVQLCTYLCIIGLIILGYQFESRREKTEGVNV